MLSEPVTAPPSRRLRSRLVWLAALGVGVGVAVPAAFGGGTAAGGGGRILSSSGVAAGGVIEFNPDVTNVVNLTSNTFNQSTDNPDGQYKSDYASVARNGTIAFASNRGGEGWRIYVMNAVGAGLRQITTSPQIGGTYPNDIDPSISPNGSQVAFISNRAGLALKNSETDLYVVNVNGSGLHQVTKGELSPNQVPSAIHGLVWSPDGSLIAFRGDRDAPATNGVPAGFQDVLGFISPSGAGEQDDPVDDCANGGAVDWVGSQVLYTYGGSVQGCPTTHFVSFDPKAQTATVIPASALGDLPSTSAGSVRFSPDGSEIVYTEKVGTTTDLVTISASGSSRRTKAAPIDIGAWLFWAPGAAVPKPAKLIITPARITLRRGGPSVQAVATLTSAAGKVISKSAADWTMDGLNGGSPICTTTGLLKATKATTPQTTTLRATNAGLKAKATVVVAK